MKNLNLKSTLFSLMAIMMVTILLSSCEKEIIIEDDVEGVKEITIGDNLEAVLAKYPKEITIDNWEEFVYAPKEVLDYHQQIELNEILTKEESELNDAKYFKGPVFGNVQAYRANAWRGISGVRMDNCGFAYTNFLGNYGLIDDCGNICATYSSPNNTAINGVSTLDLVFIEKHRLGILPFTDVRQVIAADVNRDGSISAADIVLLRRLVLGIIANWPHNVNLTFLPVGEYNEAQTLIPSDTDLMLLNYGSYSPCSPPNNPDRYVIKIGDVNGTFSF